MIMHLRRWRRLSLAIPFILSLLACTCGGTTTIAGGTTPTAATATTDSGSSGTPAASDTPAPATPIPANITNCSQIGAFSGAGAASGGSGFGDVGFPASSVSVGAGNYNDTYALTTYQFRLVNVCSNGANVSAVQSFFTSTLSTGGWSNSATFPFQGNPARACGDPYCWRNGSTPVRYVGLENVQASGSVAVYTLRVGTAPTPGAAVVLRQNTMLTGGANQTVAVSCLGNEQMLGGGFLSHNPGGDPPSHPSFTPDGNYPSAANTWSVRSGALGYSLNLTAYVFCLQANYSVGMQIVHNHLTLGSSQDVQATCPGGAVATGGGFNLTPGGDSGGIDGSEGLSAGWDAHVHTGTASTADVWALCATRDMQFFARSLTPFTIGINTIGQLSQGCGGGSLLTSGGYSGPGYLNVYGSYPTSGGTQWLTTAWNESFSTAFAASNDVVCNTLNPTF